MTRNAAIMLLVAGGLGAIGLILPILALTDSTVLARRLNSVVLIAFGVILLAGSGALTRIYAITYRLAPTTQRFGRMFLIAIGIISLLLGLVALFGGR